MRKKNTKGGKFILVIGTIAIIVVTVCAFGKNKIARKYYEYSIKKNYSAAEESEYFVEDNFNYVENYDDITIKNKSDIINSIYYTLNTGSDYTKKYIDENYSDYIEDMHYFTKNDSKFFKEEISVLNNFVHPYNSSNNIKLSYGSKYVFEIKVNRAYSDNEIDEINEIVDKVIKDKITNKMPAREKIKVIHDYIIDNTEYDKLKSDDINDTTYKSQTAYGALIQGYATCNGYSDAMAIFLDKLNIINYKISNDEHIWNFVYLDGKWYHLDLTWDDPITDVNVNRDTYFLITTKELENLNDGSHSFNKKIYSEAA